VSQLAQVFTDFLGFSWRFQPGVGTVCNGARGATCAIIARPRPEVATSVEGEREEMGEQ